MPRKKKERGRPVEKGYPPRIDATPEEIARAFFRKSPAKPLERSEAYQCVTCKRTVSYPETLYGDERYESCTEAPAE